jgi:trans-aconitate methyltransferase
MTVRLAGREVRSLAELSETYRRRITTYGFTSRTMFYNSQPQHERKLRAFADLLTGLPAGESLLDVGCGYGELLRFFEPQGQYLGIDLVREFVLEARRRYPTRRFATANLMTLAGQSDWILLVGVLSSVPNPVDLLSRACQLASKGVVFDVTLYGRLPDDFDDLCRWSLRAITEVIDQLEYRVGEVRDTDESWVIIRAESRPTKPCPESSADAEASSPDP